jgi:hypothetical protein
MPQRVPPLFCFCGSETDGVGLPARGGGVLARRCTVPGVTFADGSDPARRLVGGMLPVPGGATYGLLVGGMLAGDGAVCARPIWLPEYGDTLVGGMLGGGMDGGP